MARCEDKILTFGAMHHHPVPKWLSLDYNVLWFSLPSGDKENSIG
jgi:hypothetical protein